MIWSDGARTFSRWYIKPKPDAYGENLELALGAAAGVSTGSSTRISSCKASRSWS